MPSKGRLKEKKGGEKHDSRTMTREKTCQIWEGKKKANEEGKKPIIIGGGKGWDQVSGCGVAKGL